MRKIIEPLCGGKYKTPEMTKKIEELKDYIMGLANSNVSRIEITKILIEDLSEYKEGEDIYFTHWIEISFMKKSSAKVFKMNVQLKQSDVIHHWKGTSEEMKINGKFFFQCEHNSLREKLSELGLLYEMIPSVYSGINLADESYFKPINNICYKNDTDEPSFKPSKMPYIDMDDIS